MVRDLMARDLVRPLLTCYHHHFSCHIDVPRIKEARHQITSVRTAQLPIRGAFQDKGTGFTHCAVLGNLVSLLVVSFDSLLLFPYCHFCEDHTVPVSVASLCQRTPHFFFKQNDFSTQYLTWPIACNYLDSVCTPPHTSTEQHSLHVIYGRYISLPCYLRKSSSLSRVPMTEQAVPWHEPTCRDTVRVRGRKHITGRDSTYWV